MRIARGSRDTTFHYLPRALLVIDVDGEIHDLQVESDRLREEVLRQQGLRVLRLRKEAILRNLPGAIAAIVEAIHPLR